jgi:hypothetical protein
VKHDSQSPIALRRITLRSSTLRVRKGAVDAAIEMDAYRAMTRIRLIATRYRRSLL